MSHTTPAGASPHPYLRPFVKAAGPIALVCALIGALVGALAIAAGLALGGPKPLPALQSIADPFQNVRFEDMPALRSFSARDGTQLAYRHYQAAGTGQALGSVVLVHGSSANSQSVHPLAQRLMDAGYTVYALDIRGHGQSGARGQAAYIGQLDDDLEDFLLAMQPARPRTLLGFSSGGGFALRVAGSPRGAGFDNFLLMAPYIHHTAITYRPGDAAGWVSVGLGRLVALHLLNDLGLRYFNSLPVLGFAVSGNARADLVPQYSYTLAASFQPMDDYRAGLRAITRPTEVLVGANDELFFADQYRPLLDQAGRSDIAVTVVPATGHVGLALSAAGGTAAVAAVRRLGQRFAANSLSAPAVPHSPRPPLYSR